MGALGVAAALIVSTSFIGTALGAVPILDNPFAVAVALLPIGLVAGYLAGGMAGLLSLWLGAELGLAAFLLPSTSGGGDRGGLAGAIWLILAVALPFIIVPGWVMARLALRATGANPSRLRQLAVYLGPAATAWGLVLLAVGANAVAIQAGRSASCPTLRAHVALTGQMAFVGTNAICVTDLGTGVVHLAYASPTNVDEQLDSPTWSPDGQSIVFVRTDKQNGGQGPAAVSLVSVGAAGGPLDVLPSPPDTERYEGLSWSSTGDQIAAAADPLGCSGCGQLWVLDVTAATWRQMPLDQTVGAVSQPSWSPDGRELLVDAQSVGYGYGPVDLLKPSEGVSVTLVGDGDALSPAAWSPDGSSIAIAREVGGHGLSDIFLVSSDASAVTRRLTNSDGTDFVINDPCWSPDGQYLAVQRFASNELPDAIWLVPAAGGVPVELIEGGTQPAWTGN